MAGYPGQVPYGAPMGQQPPATNKPSAGLVVALLGLAMFLASLVALPWVSAPSGGEDAKLSDFADMSEDEAVAADMEAVSTYADGLWIAALLALTVAVVTSTLFVPQSQGGRVALGFVTAGLLGLLHLADSRGTWAHRVCGAVAVLFWALLHAGMVLDVFTVEDESSGLDAGPAIWVSFVGLLVMLVGCAVGTKTERTSPSYGYGGYGGGYGAAPQYR